MPESVGDKYRTECEAGIIRELSPCVCLQEICLPSHTQELRIFDLESLHMRNNIMLYYNKHITLPLSRVNLRCAFMYWKQATVNV